MAQARLPRALQQRAATRGFGSRASASWRTQATMKALIFDCDGVILESEDLHRRAYNAAFAHFDVQCGEEGPVVWSTEFYDMLQNKVGGGKPKMRCYFSEKGWPSSSVLGGAAPASDEDRALLIDTLQDWKTTKYQQMIGGGEVEPRPGVLRLMDEARAAGLKLAVCSAATKSSVVFTLNNLIGEGRFHGLDVFLAGDDVDKKKPDPTIYRVAAEKLGLDPAECVVIEDSYIGLRAALDAGMRCIITYTPSTMSQGFPGAEMVVPDLGEEPPRIQEFHGAERIVGSLGGEAAPEVTAAQLVAHRIVQDDRIEMTVTDSGVYFHIPGQ